MCEKAVSTLGVMGVVIVFLAGPLFAADIIWVDEGAIQGFDGWRDLLERDGHTVERMSDMGTLDDAKIDAMNAADLVIVSRDTNSGSYDDGEEIDQWNGLTVPLIQTSSYLVRSSRWQWLNDTATPAIGATDNMLIVEDHPIFAGVGSAGDEIAMVNTAANLTGATDGGNGLVLATHTDGRLWITLWEEVGTPFYDGTSQSPAAARMWFAAGEGINGDTKGAMNLTEEGQAIFLNAVRYLTGETHRVNAYGPSPKTGVRVDDTWTVLSWRSGDYAVSRHRFRRCEQRHAGCAGVRPEHGGERADDRPCGRGSSGRSGTGSYVLLARGRDQRRQRRQPLERRRLELLGPAGGCLGAVSG